MDDLQILKIISYLIIEDLVSKGRTADLSPLAIVGCYGQQLAHGGSPYHAGRSFGVGCHHQREHSVPTVEMQEAEDLRQNEVNIENVKAHDVPSKDEVSKVRQWE